MRSKVMQLSNFSRAIKSTSACYRPEKETDLPILFHTPTDVTQRSLVRGKGLSYSDCCFNDSGLIIDTSRLNHLLSFDEATETVTCQPGVTFADLFLVHPDYIPPVIPGTLHATLGGGIANDIHGKNNPAAKTLGHHLVGFDLQTDKDFYHCSPTENSELFRATIGGLGLTGMITRITLKLRKASRFVRVHTEKHYQWEPLLLRMQELALLQDYQVAWLDLLNAPRALLSYANHTEPQDLKAQRTMTIPPLPLCLVSKMGMALFNHYFFQRAKTSPYSQALSQFNNPLDNIRHWNRLYGKKGLLQFQAVINADMTLAILNELMTIIKNHRITPTLAVLKYFTESGSGLLSFPEPGFTLAIDFIHCQAARDAIRAMNEVITDIGGKLYLAKDLLMTSVQFARQYPLNESFKAILTRYPSSMQSNLSCRLGITS